MPSDVRQNLQNHPSRTQPNATMGVSDGRLRVKPTVHRLRVFACEYKITKDLHSTNAAQSVRVHVIDPVVAAQNPE